MHADEYRDYKLIRELRIAETLSDPEHVYNQLESLSGAKTGSSGDKSDSHDLRRRVQSAHGALDDLRAENEELSRQKILAEQRLATVRSSTTFRVGKIVLSPVHTTRSVIRNPKTNIKKFAVSLKSNLIKVRTRLLAEQRNLQRRKESGESKGQGHKLGSPEQPGAQSADPSKTNSKSSTGSHIVKSANEPSSSRPAKSALNPFEQFKAKPSARSFERALNYLWFNEGEISRTATLIEDYPQYVEKLGEVPKSVAARVLGTSRIQSLQLVAQRSEYPAYVPEPERIMYCVHQSPVYNSNGYSTRARGIANGIHAAGGDVVVVARSGYPWDSKADTEKPKVMRTEVMLDDVQYVHVPGGNLNREPIDHYVMQCADAFVREARILRPSVIQAASNYRTALPALIAARRLGVPFVYEVRGLWELTEASKKPGFENSERFGAMRDLETLVAKNADRVLAITIQIKEELVSRGVDPDTITVAPNSVDPNVFVPLPKDKNYAQSKGINTEVPVLGFAGSIVGYEGLDLLVGASELLRARGVEHQVVIAGSGAADDELKEQVKIEGLEQQVLFLGRLPQNEMPRLQSTFDIVVCPRRSNLVTQMVSPLKPLESFASGKATVLSDVAPNIDLAGENQERALLSSADDAVSLADQLEKLIKNPELMADLGRTSRLWAVKERSWKKLGERILKSHKDAHIEYEKLTSESRTLRSLRVGVIGDEFTRSTLEDAFDVELLDRDAWEKQLDMSPEFDLIFVESAWEGNNGDWHRGVGHYSEEESSDLQGLLALARQKGIPTVFWNKEDPIHISRFAPNASLFDHVFTTDANMIPRYLKAPNCQNQTVSALPFYAQPKLHNPLPADRGFRKSIAYAGSYYGDRYKERSRGLVKLLEASAKYPMDIYDRQANNPDSPYKFPEAYRGAVRGGLQYQEVVKSYSTHIAHLNVNSVLNSPTMFSRRVVEIPACGGIVMSAYSRGIAETLGSNIAHSNKTKDHRAWLHDWMNNPTGRLDEIWRQMRTVYRSHTTDSAMAIVLRTAGIPVLGLESPKYTAHLELEGVETLELRTQIVNDVARQSIRPVQIVVSGVELEELKSYSTSSCNASSVADPSIDSDFDVYFPVEFSRTFAEDVLLPTRFGNYSSIYTKPAELFEIDEPIVSRFVDNSAPSLTLAVKNSHDVEDSSVVITLPKVSSLPIRDDSSNLEEPNLAGKTVLVAGHDLKFAGAMLDELRGAGCEVLIDKWDGHNKHDEARSKDLLGKADVVLCEWGLGNAVWYSQNLLARQSMVVRVHSQELFLPFLKKIKKSSVDKFIFVGELIRKAAIESHGVPEAKAIVFPNFVNMTGLDIPKKPGSEKTLGFVGIVPKSKRLDRALDILEGLLNEDPEYKLRIKGKTPEDYPWMKNRPAELEYYSGLYARIDAINARYPGAVIFDGFGADMEEWYSTIGIAISTSEFESFHFTIADGAASAAAPVSLNWPGADLIYPHTWLYGTTNDMIEAIQSNLTKGEIAKQFALSSFQESERFNQLIQGLLKH